jgi:hypothetical protein
MALIAGVEEDVRARLGLATTDLRHLRKRAAADTIVHPARMARRPVLRR